MSSKKYGARITAVLFTSALLVAACGSDDEADTTTAAPADTSATPPASDTGTGDTVTGDTATGDTAGGGTASGTIALLLPESKNARYETQDRPLFEAKVAELCADCEVISSNADQDAAKQQSQAEAALTNGANVLVLDPVDGQAAASIVKLAAEKDVPVISYDRLIQNADVALYISFDNEQVGVLQATALVDKLAADGITEGDIVMINGAATDNNASLFKKGAHSVLDASGFTIANETDTVEWSADNAQKDMDGAIITVGKENIVGVYAANDGTAGGAIASMKAAGVSPLPPVTGQDAEVAGLQRILIGDQYMTVYKAIKLEAEGAAEAAVQLLNGTELVTTGVTNNGQIDVPSIILTPVAITKETVKDVIADGYWSAADICTADFATACEDAGIS
jgi:D-xylose transport system substrate-binding protein